MPSARVSTLQALTLLAAVSAALAPMPGGPHPRDEAWTLVSLASSSVAGTWDRPLALSVSLTSRPASAAGAPRAAIVQTRRAGGPWQDMLTSSVNGPSSTLWFTPRHAGIQGVRVYLPGTGDRPAATSNELEWDIRPAPSEAAPVDTVSVDAASVVGVVAARAGTPVPGAFGAVRLWDAGVTWREVEHQPGRYWWDRLDAAVDAAQSAGQSVLYTFGSTPEFYADPIDHPELELYGPGSTQPPVDMERFREFATAVVSRYAGRIEAYQAGNEIDLPAFWQGTATQAAEMTAILHDVVAAGDPGALVVGSSFTTRHMASTYPFTSAYLAELVNRGWPVDAVAAHFYPLPSGDASDVGRLMGMVQRILRDSDAPPLPVWDTEVNARANPTAADLPLPPLTDSEVRAFVAQVYLRGVSAGVTRTYWYAWLREVPYLGISMYDGTVAAATVVRLRELLDDVVDMGGCTTSVRQLTSCPVTLRSGRSGYWAWSEVLADGSPATESLAELGRTGEVLRLDGSAEFPVPQGVSVGSEPVLVTMDQGDDVE